MSPKANGAVGPAKDHHDAAEEQGQPSTQRRRLKARAPVVVASAFVSQLTSLALLGVDPRRYLDRVLPLCKADVVHVGKLRLLPLDVAVAALRTTFDAGDEPQSEDGEPRSVDDVLSRLGKERAP